jgi:hypothetical protein
MSALISPEEIMIPLSDACLKCGAKATMEAKKCSNFVSLKSAILWTFPGLGYALTSRSVANCKQHATCSDISMDIDSNPLSNNTKKVY